MLPHYSSPFFPFMIEGSFTQTQLLRDAECWCNVQSIARPKMQLQYTRTSWSLGEAKHGILVVTHIHSDGQTLTMRRSGFTYDRLALRCKWLCRPTWPLATRASVSRAEIALSSLAWKCVMTFNSSAWLLPLRSICFSRTDALIYFRRGFRAY